MALFHLGQLLVYGNIGVCKVEDICTQHFFEDRAGKEYYTLHPFFARSGDKIYVPTSTTTASLRPVLNQKEAASLLDSLKTTDAAVFCSRSQASLMLHYQDLMQANTMPDRLRLFKELCQKEQLQRQKGRKLNPTDMHFYKLTEQLLSEEFAIALDKTPAEMRTTLRRAALS